MNNPCPPRRATSQVKILFFRPTRTDIGPCTVEAHPALGEPSKNQQYINSNGRKKKLLEGSLTRQGRTAASERRNESNGWRTTRAACFRATWRSTNFTRRRGHGVPYETKRQRLEQKQGEPGLSSAHPDTGVAWLNGPILNATVESIACTPCIQGLREVVP